MRIINAVGPTTSSLSPSFSATRVTDLSFFHISPRIRCRAVPVNKRFPWSSTLQEDHHRANHKRTSSYSFNRSFSISPLFAQSHSHSSLSLLFFFFSSLHFAFSPLFGRLFTLYQCSTRLLGIPDGVPAHATGSPATLDFVLWNPNTLVWSGALDIQSATGNPWTAASAQLPPANRWNRVCKTLFPTSSRRTDLEKAATVITMTKTGTRIGVGSFV